METDQKRQMVTFAGNVAARQGELVIHADTMEVYYRQEKRRTDSQAIDRLIARGHVKVLKKEWTATGDELEYFAGRRLAVLTGNASAWQGNNMVRGQKIELYLDEGRTVVERQKNSPERVKAFFYPGGK